MSKKVIDTYFSLIKKYYPDISPENITVFQDGYDHDILLLPNQQAFRFPRTKNHGKKDQVENIFLPLFAKISPVPIPQITNHTDPETGIKFQQYPFIPGIQLSRNVAQTLTQNELVNIARDMGGFLTALHSFSLSDARSMNMDELDPNTYWQYFEELLGKIKVPTFSLLSKSEKEWIEKLVNDYIDISRGNPFKVKVTHSDLLSEHILIDEKTHKLSGIIDFSLRIADPANDFGFFDRYGPVFLKTVYKNYLPVDEFFDQRRKFYAGHIPLINLYESVGKKDVKMIEVHLVQLREYISENQQSVSLNSDVEN